MFLFLAVNLLVLVTLSATLSLPGIQPYLTARGLDYRSLALFCLPVSAGRPG
jgi:heat shock protein HtpX